MTAIDEYSRECLAILMARTIRSDDFLDLLTDLFVEHEAPDHIRSYNGPEFIANKVRKWLSKAGVKTFFNTPESPQENGYNEAFNGRLRKDVLNGEIVFSPHEAQVIIESWRHCYNKIRPHSALGHCNKDSTPSVRPLTTTGLIGRVGHQAPRLKGAIPLHSML